MKRNGQKTQPARTQTIADLVMTVSKLTRDERLGAYIVADMINARLVRLEGKFHGRRVVVG
ncbi:MAG: hypothetical protein WCS70_00920 [Verrucomicrobiota bacterium]